MRGQILFEKYKEVFSYCFFGVCTTAVNLATYWMMAHVVGTTTVRGTIIAWFVAVLFAYITNRKWVFQSSVHSFVALIREMLLFYSCRLVTGILDWVIMYVFVDQLHCNDLIIKMIANIIVIIGNYIASKLLIFKHRND